MTEDVNDILKSLTKGKVSDELSKYVSECQLANDRIDGKRYREDDVKRCIAEFGKEAKVPNPEEAQVANIKNHKEAQVKVASELEDKKKAKQPKKNKK